MPLSMPASPSFRDCRFRLISNAARFVSPLTRVGQSVARIGDFWSAAITLPPLTRDQARAWTAILASMAGQAESLYVGPPVEQDDLGALGTPRVNGAAQAGTTLIVDGFPAGKTLAAGIWFSYDTATFRSLHVTTAAFAADGAGAGSLAIAPAIRKSPAEDALIEFIAPSCEMVLEDASADALNLQQSVTWGVSLSLIENVRA